MGVYAYNTFFDILGTEHKVEIIDTTYSSTVYEFKTAAPGYDLNIVGLEEEIFFNPRFRTNVTVYAMVNEGDAMDALFADIPNAKEQQYWIKIYRKVSSSWVLYWVGQLVPDSAQADDEYPYLWQIKATDGLVRLDDFDFDYALEGNPYEYVSDLEIIRQCLLKIGVDQFYSGSDNYISSCIDFWEDAQRTTAGQLIDTRAVKAAYIQDIENSVAMKCGEVLDMVLKKWGANIRMDGGRWYVTQPRNCISTTSPTYFNYLKTGALNTSGSASSSITISGSNEVAGDNLTDLFRPMLKNVDVNTAAKSVYQSVKTVSNNTPFEIQTNINNYYGAHQLKIDFTINVSEAYNLSLTKWDYFVKFNIYTATETLVIFTPYDFETVTFVNNAYLNGKERPTFDFLFKNQHFEAGVGTSPINVLQGSFTFPRPSLFSSQDLTIIVEVVAPNSPQSPVYTGTVRVWDTFDNQSNEEDFPYQTTVATLNDASYQIKETVAFGDIPQAFCPQQIQIYTGSVWQPSSTWYVSGGSSGIPLSQLLSQEALFMQRNPREMIQGAFRIGGYFTHYVIYWRSKYWLLLFGTYHADMATWDCRWMELKRENASTVSQSTNPYRNTINQIKKDQGKIDFSLSGVKGVVANHGQILADLIDRMKQLESNTSYGVDGFLTNNVEGLDGAGVGTKLTLKVQAEAGYYKLIAE